MPHHQVSPCGEELRAGEDTRCPAQALRTERIERVEWPAVNKQRGEGMEEEFEEHPQDDMSQYQDYPYEYDY